MEYKATESGGPVKFEKGSSAQSHLTSITKPRQNKTKITGAAKQNICRPDLVVSLQIGEVGWGYFGPCL